MRCIELLRQVAPNWVTIESQSEGALYFSAKIIRAGGVLSREYKLKAEGLSERSVSIEEQAVGTLLPSWCPERHVNLGGSFCLGLNAGINIANLTDAAAWWRKIEVFLECQETAHNTGRWPRAIQLSHGEAGEIQERAELLAASKDLQSELELSIYFDSGPIANAVRRFLKGKSKSRRCACLCGKSDKRGRPLLRKQCQRNSNECLILLEARRRDAEREFWESFKKADCCGSDSRCPLKRLK